MSADDRHPAARVATTADLLNDILGARVVGDHRSQRRGAAAPFSAGGWAAQPADSLTQELPRQLRVTCLPQTVIIHGCTARSVAAAGVAREGARPWSMLLLDGDGDALTAEFAAVGAKDAELRIELDSRNERRATVNLEMSRARSG